MPPLTQHIMTSQQSKCEGQPKEFQHPAQHQDLNVKRKKTDQFNCLLSVNFSYLPKSKRILELIPYKQLKSLWRKTAQKTLANHDKLK